MRKNPLLLLAGSLALIGAALFAIFLAHPDPTRAALQGEPAPNLVPHAPDGWSLPVVPTFITGTNTTGSLFAGLAIPTYFDWAVSNASSAAVSTPSVVCLSVDDVQINTWTVDSYAPDAVVTIEDWAYALPNSGQFTVTLETDCTDQIDEGVSGESDNVWTGTFTWLPYNGVIVSDEQGFDKCEIATLEEMSEWAANSPYDEVNIYLGGISRACANADLDSEWVRQVVEMGWNLIPTWVGPQAPCSSFAHRFSWNPALAWQQGRNEADAALQAANLLGLTPPGSQTVIYYDLEAYPNNPLCREAAGALLSGWVARLNERGHRAGVYGAGCGSYVTDWASLPHVPDDVWLAHWIFSAYNSSAKVTGVACVPDNLWSQNQRIRQYTGGHDETWGGVKLNIDSNVLLGHVAGVNIRATSDSTATFPLIQDMQLLNPTEGWVLQDGRLLKTDDNGAHWTDITPPGAAVRAAFFLNPDEGWSAVLSEQGAVSLFHTPDGGQTWQPAGTLPANFPDGTGRITLHFVDRQTGWVAVTRPSSSNFSLGALFHTTDGGQTWEELTLPIGAPVYFADAQRGWTAGGAAGNELYATRDGGRAWTPLHLTTGPAYYALPTFLTPQTGLLPVTLPDETHPRVAFFLTEDGGQTWTLAAHISLLPTPIRAPLPTAILSRTDWLVTNPADGTLYLTADGGQTVQQKATRRPGVLVIQFRTLEAGWLLAFIGECAGTKGADDFFCAARSELLRTSDAGNHWESVHP